MQQASSERSTWDVEVEYRPAQSLLAGDVWFNLWSQYEVDFLQVLGISATGKTVICIRIDKEHADEESVRPNYLRYGQSFRLRVARKKDGRIFLRGTYPVYGGLTRFGQFVKYERGAVEEIPVSIHPYDRLYCS